MSDKKILLPTHDQVAIYGNKKLIKTLNQNPLEDLVINVENPVKSKTKFCSTIKTFLNWKDMVKNILNNTDYKNDKR